MRQVASLTVSLPSPTFCCYLFFEAQQMTDRRTGGCDSSVCLFPCMTNMQRSVKVEYIERGI